MRAYIVKEGIEVIAVKFEGMLRTPQIEKKLIKKETLYYTEDIAVDPIGKVGAGPQNNTLGGQWARKGFYGFQLPKNKSGYELLLVHGYDLIIA